jgi:zinc transport system substrate-binding protein
MSSSKSYPGKRALILTVISWSSPVSAPVAETQASCSRDKITMGKTGWSLIVTSILLLSTIWLTAAAGCSSNSFSSQKFGVAVSIMPQADFIENVGKDKVNVTVMVPQNANPHTYEPKPNQMKNLSEAKLYAKVGSGIEFELVWMDKILSTNKNMLIVDCSKDLQFIKMTAEDSDEGESHGGLDPHIWMSPANAKIMVSHICDGMIQIDSSNKAYYEQNRDVYLQKLTQLDKDIRDGLANVKNRKFLVYHPAFGYFANEYNLTMLAIEEAGKEPTAAGIARVIQQAKENNIKVVFASPQFNQQSARVIADGIGGTVVLVDHLAKDYMCLILSELIRVMK